MIIRSHRESDCRLGVLREFQYGGTRRTTEVRFPRGVEGCRCRWLLRPPLTSLPKVPEARRPVRGRHERAVSGADLRRHCDVGCAEPDSAMRQDSALMPPDLHCAVIGNRSAHRHDVSSGARRALPRRGRWRPRSSNRNLGCCLRKPQREIVPVNAAPSRSELDAVSRHWSCSRSATGCGARREPGHYCKSRVVERRTVCSIDLTQSIRPNVLRRVPVGTRRLGLRRGSPLLRVRKPTVGYVADLADLRAATDCLCRYTWAGYEKLNVQCRRWRVLPWYHWERFP